MALTIPGAPSLPLTGGTLTGSIGFSTTNTIDIGTSATVLAPRTVYAGTSVVTPVVTATTSSSLAVATATSLTLPTGQGTLIFSTDLFAGRAAAANLRLGAADVDTAPVAQTLSVQNVLAGGTSNVAGANFTIAGSQGKGTGAGGSLIFQTAPAGSTGTTVNALVTALTISSTGMVSTSNGSGSTAGLLGLEIGAGTGVGLWNGGANNFVFAASGIDIARLSATTFRLGSGGVFGLTSAAAGSAADTSLSRISAGVWGVGTGAAGSVAGTLQVANITMTAAGVLQLGNARAAGVLVQGGSVTMKDSGGNTITVLTT